jgi:hypothetical protein
MIVATLVAPKIVSDKMEIQREKPSSDQARSLLRHNEATVQMPSKVEILSTLEKKGITVTGNFAKFYSDFADGIKERRIDGNQYDEAFGAALKTEQTSPTSSYTLAQLETNYRKVVIALAPDITNAAIVAHDKRLRERKDSVPYMAEFSL